MLKNLLQICAHRPKKGIYFLPNIHKLCMSDLVLVILLVRSQQDWNFFTNSLFYYPQQKRKSTYLSKMANKQTLRHFYLMNSRLSFWSKCIDQEEFFELIVSDIILIHSPTLQSIKFLLFSYFYQFSNSKD